MASNEVAVSSKSFDDVYAREYVGLVQLAHLLTGSDAAGEDIVQDCFAEALRRWDAIDNPGAYVRTSVVNGARRRHQRRAVEERLGNRVAGPATVEADVGRELWDALATLPFRQRAALVLRFYEDRTTEEIAATLGCRPATARSLLHRGTAALVAAVVVLVVAVRIIDGGTGPAPPLPVVEPLPDRPPVVEGTVLGQMSAMCPTGSTDPDCSDGPAELDLRHPTEPHLVTRSTGVDIPVLSDGRLVRSEGALSVVDPTSGATVPVEARRGAPVAALPDGRLAVIDRRSHTGNPAQVRIIDADGTTATIRLPSDLDAHAVAAGPEGWIAVLGDGDRQCCLNRAQLVLVAPDGSMRRVDVRDAVADRDPTMTGLALSWSSRGLLAISGTRLAPPGSDRLFDWTVVVDPTTAERVAVLDGQGLAWSPDGSGLLTARRTSQSTADLRLFWGPGLRRHTDLGAMERSFTPYWWNPPDPETGT